MYAGTKLPVTYYNNEHAIDDASISTAKLSNHDKTNHDSLNINADTLDTKHASDFAASDHSHSVGDAATLDGIDSTGFALANHTHESTYAPLSHNQAETTITFTDITTGNANTTNHGLLPKLNNEPAQFLNGQGSWAVPSSGGIPTGVICMWSGLLVNIPSGWALCNGANGTPDLREKFIKGSANGIDPGATGGSSSYSHAGAGVDAHAVTQPSDHASHTHTYTEVVNHVHVQKLPSGQTGSQASGTRDTSTTGSINDALSTNNPAGGAAQGTTNGPSATLTHSGTAVAAHVFTQSNDHAGVEPVYFALAFIMKT